MPRSLEMFSKGMPSTFLIKHWIPLYLFNTTPTISTSFMHILNPQSRTLNTHLRQQESDKRNEGEKHTYGSYIDEIHSISDLQKKHNTLKTNHYSTITTY